MKTLDISPPKCSEHFRLVERVVERSLLCKREEEKTHKRSTIKELKNQMSNDETGIYVEESLAGSAGRRLLICFHSSYIVILLAKVSATAAAASAVKAIRK